MDKTLFKNISKRTIGTIIIPLIVLVVLLIICAANGVNLFSTGDSYLIFVRGTATVMLTTIALAINLNSGRFDFSIGSIAVLSSVLAADICIKMNGGAIVFLGLSVLFGCILGLVSGGIYVLLKLPPIITSLGVTLLFEGISFAYTGGANLRFVMNTDLIGFAKSPMNFIIIIAVVLVLVILLFSFTNFGYNYRSLQSGQKVSVNMGIKEIPNTLICYAVSGAMMGIVGFINGSQQGVIAAGTLNFSSIGIMFTAFLPMFIGNFIGRYSNNNLGYLLGAITTTLISLFYSAMTITTATRSIITAVLLVVFLIYLNNENKIIELISIKKHIKNIEKKKKNASLGEANELEK